MDTTQNGYQGKNFENKYRDSIAREKLLSSLTPQNQAKFDKHLIKNEIKNEKDRDGQETNGTRFLSSEMTNSGKNQARDSLANDQRREKNNFIEQEGLKKPQTMKNSDDERFVPNFGFGNWKCKEGNENQKNVKCDSKIDFHNSMYSNKKVRDSEISFGAKKSLQFGKTEYDCLKKEWNYRQKNSFSESNKYKFNEVQNKRFIGNNQKLMMGKPKFDEKLKMKRLNYEGQNQKTSNYNQKIKQNSFFHQNSNSFFKKSSFNEIPDSNFKMNDWKQKMRIEFPQKQRHQESKNEFKKNQNLNQWNGNQKPKETQNQGFYMNPQQSFPIHEMEKRRNQAFEWQKGFETGVSIVLDRIERIEKNVNDIKSFLTKRSYSEARFGESPETYEEMSQGLPFFPQKTYMHNGMMIPQSFAHSDKKISSISSNYGSDQLFKHHKNLRSLFIKKNQYYGNGRRSKFNRDRSTESNQYIKNRHLHRRRRQESLNKDYRSSRRKKRIKFSSPMLFKEDYPTTLRKIKNRKKERRLSKYKKEKIKLLGEDIHDKADLESFENLDRQMSRRSKMKKREYYESRMPENYPNRNYKSQMNGNNQFYNQRETQNFVNHNPKMYQNANEINLNPNPETSFFDQRNFTKESHYQLPMNPYIYQPNQSFQMPKLGQRQHFDPSIPIWRPNKFEYPQLPNKYMDLTNQKFNHREPFGFQKDNTNSQDQLKRHPDFPIQSNINGNLHSGNIIGPIINQNPTTQIMKGHQNQKMIYNPPVVRNHTNSSEVFSTDTRSLDPSKTFHNSISQFDDSKQNQMEEEGESLKFFGHTFRLLKKLISLDEIFEKDIELTNIQKEFVIEFMKKKKLCKNLKLDDFTVKTLTTLRDNESVRRTEERLKFVFKKCLRYMQKKFRSKLEVKGPDSKKIAEALSDNTKFDYLFYSHYYGKISNRRGIPIEKFFHFRNWKNRVSEHIPKSITKEYVACLKMNPSFMQRFIVYMNTRLVRDVKMSNTSKILRLVNHWEAQYEKNQSEEVLKQILNRFAKKGLKLPWGLNEIRCAIKDTQNYIFKK